jgi:lipoprotein-anchoring transpeptidase ErfK/SrfK
VAFKGRYAKGTIIVDTSDRALYYVTGKGQAIKYGVGVGRQGFQWSGVGRISRKAVWPSWRPPAPMLRRQPHLPKFMPGGPRNPLGARALYIGGTLFRIHGTNERHTIGRAVSSGCIRMLNREVIDLYNRVRIGARVIVRR